VLILQNSYARSIIDKSGTITPLRFFFSPVTVYIVLMPIWGSHS